MLTEHFERGDFLTSDNKLAYVKPAVIQD